MDCRPFVKSFCLKPQKQNDPHMELGCLICDLLSSTISCIHWPIGSMHGIFTHIWLVVMINVDTYNIRILLWGRIFDFTVIRGIFYCKTLSIKSITTMVMAIFKKTCHPKWQQKPWGILKKNNSQKINPHDQRFPSVCLTSPFLTFLSPQLTDPLRPIPSSGQGLMQHLEVTLLKHLARNRESMCPKRIGWWWIFDQSNWC